MKFILNILSTVLSRIFFKSNKNSSDDNKNIEISTQDNTALSEARASVIWVCVVCVAIYWVVQYVVADIFWIKACIAHNSIVKFPLDDKKLFDLLYSVLGIGVAGAIHKFIK